MVYKILKMGDVYTINRVSKESWGIEYIPSLPIKYFKTLKGAMAYAKKTGKRIL